jgi:uncharacterized membrane protein HdeD (DUF308 family)
MNNFQRIKKILSGLVMLLGSLVLVIDPENGYYVIAFLLSISLLMSGVRSLVYYFTMARNMVGDTSILYTALVMTDLGLFTLTTITIPKIYLICHLLISHAFSGAVDMMKAIEDKRMQATSWRMSFIYGLGNLLTAVAAFTCILNQSTALVVEIYCIGLAYSGIMQIASAFRKTAIIYIP